MNNRDLRLEASAYVSEVLRLVHDGQYIKAEIRLMYARTLLEPLIEAEKKRNEG